MTNEELARQIKAGDRTQQAVLWAQVHDLIAWQAGRYWRQYGERCAASGVTVEDLIQEGYFAMLEAVSAYDGTYGFNAYLSYPLRNHFNALAGLRTRKAALNPLSRAQSLDAPVNDDGFTLADILPDSAAETALEGALERAYTEQLHRDLDIALATLDDEQQTVVRGRYYQGHSLEQAGQAMGRGKDEARRVLERALARLRTGKARRILEPYRNEIASQYGLRGVGVATFRNTWASATERAAFKLLELDEQGRKEDCNLPYPAQK